MTERPHPNRPVRLGPVAPEHLDWPLDGLGDPELRDYVAGLGPRSDLERLMGTLDLPGEVVTRQVMRRLRLSPGTVASATPSYEVAYHLLGVVGSGVAIGLAQDAVRQVGLRWHR